MADTYIYSAYIFPNGSQEEFEAILDNLAEHVRGQYPIIVAGNFNALALEWSSRNTNKRSEVLLDVFAFLDLVLMNDRSTPTFRETFTPRSSI